MNESITLLNQHYDAHQEALFKQKDQQKRFLQTEQLFKTEKADTQQRLTDLQAGIASKKTELEKFDVSAGKRADAIRAHRQKLAWEKAVAKVGSSGYYRSRCWVSCIVRDCLCSRCRSTARPLAVVVWRASVAAPEACRKNA